MVTLSLVITGWGAKSTTCSFKDTFFTIRSTKGTLNFTPSFQTVRNRPRRVMT